MMMGRFRLWTTIADPAERDWLGELPDDVVLLVSGYLPPGPIGRGDFRSLCKRTRRLANSTTTKARVSGWNQAAQMGTTFPQLEQLEVDKCISTELAGLREFLEHSVPQLTRLVSLEVGRELELPFGVMQQLCRGMPQLRRLKLPLQLVEQPLTSFTLQLHQFGTQEFEVCDDVGLASHLSSLAPLSSPDCCV